jgi:NAD(P)H-hydrate epimerase
MTDRTYMEITAEIAAQLLPERPADGHKGTFGHLLILAGSRGFTGAAKLAAMGALRSGAGLVSVGTPEPLDQIVAGGAPESMCHPMPSTPEGTFAPEAVQPALDFASRVTAVAMGPGISQHVAAQHFVRQFLKQCTVPLLLDADALNALAGETAVLESAECETVVTPHPGEMSRLAKLATGDIQTNRAGVAERFAEEWGTTVVLKGQGTVVAAPGEKTAVNTTGNSGMATGGTGDALTGLLGGLLAQGLSPYDAARLAVFVHGRAGDLAAADKTGRGMTATDLIERIPDAWKELEALTR